MLHILFLCLYLCCNYTENDMSFIKRHFHEEINENHRNRNIDADYEDWKYFHEFESFQEWVETAEGVFSREEIAKSKQMKQEIEEQYATDPNDPDYLPF